MNFIFMAASNTILDASKNAGIGQFLLAVLSFICLAIDSVVYFAITVAYKLFLALAQFEIFNNEAFDYLINRTYIIIGVVSLFVVAYSLLNSIINPDNASKGNKSFAKIVKNVVIAIVGVAIVPTIFNYFYYFQRVVLCNNFIPRLILQQVNTDTSTLENIATELPELIFESFFYPNGLVADGNSDDNNFTDDLITSEASKIIIGHSNPIYDTDTYSLADAYTNAKNGYSFWTSFEPFIFSSPGVSDNSIQYLIILSTVAGGYIAYVFLNLCLDMGLRAVKLGYLELIAPLAIMTSIVPGQDGVFKNWSKKTISCAVEVFTRLFVVVFAVYLVGTVKNLLQPSFGSTICGLTLNPVYILLMRAIIYFSIFAFAKKAPKFFSEATGIKSDGFKIGLLDKMKENGMVQAFGAIGGGVTSGVRNFAANGGDNWQNAKNAWKNKNYGAAFEAAMKGAGGGIAHPGSFVAGTASGLRRGWSNTKDVKKWSNIKDGAGKAADEAMEAKLRRQDYKEAHGGTTWGAVTGHVKDAFAPVLDYPNSHSANYAYEQKKHNSIEKISKAESAINDKVKAMMEDKKEDLIDSTTGKTLGVIRREQEESQQAVNAAVQALTEAKLSGDATRITAANQVLTDAKAARDAAQKATKTAERKIKADIRSNRQSEIFNQKDLMALDGLYTAYQTSVSDNLASLADNQNAYSKAKELTSLDHDAFRAQVEDTVREEIIRDVDGNTVLDDDGNAKKRKIKFIDDVKVASAEAINKMNQESEAARKQQEKK